MIVICSLEREQNNSAAALRREVEPKQAAPASPWEEYDGIGDAPGAVHLACGIDRDLLRELAGGDDAIEHECFGGEDRLSMSHNKVERELTVEVNAVDGTRLCVKLADAFGFDFADVLVLLDLLAALLVAPSPCRAAARVEAEDLWSEGEEDFWTGDLSEDAASENPPEEVVIIVSVVEKLGSGQLIGTLWLLDLGQNELAAPALSAELLPIDDELEECAGWVGVDCFSFGCEGADADVADRACDVLLRGDDIATELAQGGMLCSLERFDEAAAPLPNHWRHHRLRREGTRGGLDGGAEKHALRALDVLRTARTPSALARLGAFRWSQGHAGPGLDRRRAPAAGQ